jgi:23S rRNA-/tRNA-specific pseudouridylate synthase
VQKTETALPSGPQIVYENNEFILINKPSGWLSIPGRNNENEVVSLWLSKHLQGESPFIVHRLDKITSGIMLFAKSAEAHRLANSWFLKREVKKEYCFLATPAPTRPAVQIKTPIEGKPAQTLFEVIEKSALAFYGKATPLTGRFHQIREHAREAGFPLLGDKPYGGPTSIEVHGKKVLIERACLHAHRLVLPFGEFEAPLPDDFKQLIQTLIRV